MWVQILTLSLTDSVPLNAALSFSFPICKIRVKFLPYWLLG